MSIGDFLASKPSLSEIFEFVESEAQRIVSEKKQHTEAHKNEK